ncbi:MAG: transposase [Proteobacteria bacterium]|nr:transposase [Pseudomonadota bacterium]
MGWSSNSQVKTCIDSFDGRLEIFLLPSYSPDLNPIEQLWNHTKNNGVGIQPVNGPDQLKRAVINKLRRLQKLPKIISSFFRHPECVYILSE